MADQPFRYSPGENIYGSLATGIANSTPALVNPYGSFGGNLASVLGAGLLSGLLGYQARSEAQDSTQTANRAALQIYGAKTPEERQAIAEAAPSDAFGYDVRGDLLGLTQQIGQKQLFGTIDAENQKKLRAAQFEAELEAQKNRFGAFTESEAGAPNAPKAPEAMSIFSDAVPLDVKKDRRTQELILRGIPEGRAIEQAERELVPERLLQKQAVKKVETLRARSEELKQVTDSLRMGIAGAGKTGGPAVLNYLRGTGMSIAAALGNDDQAAKQAAETDLSEAMVKISAMAKKPGEGAVSDYERKLFLATAPGPDRTPAENERILQRLQRLQEIEGQYADFLEAAVTSGVSMEKAQKKWREYTAANPVIVEDPSTKVVYDMDRPSWEEYFGLTGKASENMMPATAQVEAPVAPSVQAPSKLADALAAPAQAPAPAMQVQAAPVAPAPQAQAQPTREQILAAIARKRALMQAQGR